MSLASNVNSVSYYSGYDVDKIARIFTGSYNSGTDVISRVYTLFGAPYTVYFYRIEHGLGRPVECELLWSTDGGTTYIDGGVANGSLISKIAFSDSTYVYIFDAQGSIGSGVVNYRVYCSWIDNYDDTNPLVPVLTYNNLPQQFDSRENYQKIYSSGIFSYSPGVFGAIETQAIVHPLGYAPNVKVYFEAFLGEVWPLNSGGASNFFLIADSQDECDISIDTGSVSVSMTKFSNQAKRAWYKVYYDQS